MPPLAEKTTSESSHPLGTSLRAGEETHEQPVIAFFRTPAQADSEGSAPLSGGRLRRRWAIGVGAAIGALLLFALFHSHRAEPPAAVKNSAIQEPKPTLTPPQTVRSTAYSDTIQPGAPPLLSRSTEMKSSIGVTSGASSSTPAAPMIAHTVSLTLQVKDIVAGRLALDIILARYQGYAAELNINTPENAARSFGASLRIPAPTVPSALAELRKLGHVQNESQTGEEVTAQHIDLVARLENARETEHRLLAILQQRTGKVEDVLEVEEQISNTRGEIERMEAEQKALEHRVDFATVQVQLTEEFKAQLNAPSTSVGTRVHNSFVAGLANAGDSILSILLFLEEYGPMLLVWLVVLGAPAWLLWRRYRHPPAKI